MNGFLSRLSSLYDGYLETVTRLESERKFGEGMFGLKSGPKDNPCHDRFDQDLKSLLQELTPGETDPALLRDVLEYIYEAPIRNPYPKSAYWMMIAVQDQTKDLVAGLKPEDADILAASYAENYPRSQRLPVQIELYRLLCQAGTGTASEKRFSFFGRR
jgi:hypothetical protein